MKPSLLLVACALSPGLARADDANLRPYLIGQRAAGMGGAYTALADDGTGPYYNPGGIAFATRPSLSLSASVYGVVSGAYANVLGDGHDFRYSDLNTFPVSTAIVRELGPRDAPDGSQSSSIGLAVFVPDAFQIDDRDHLGSGQNAFFLSSISQTVWAGLTYAHRSGRLGIGVSVFGLLGDETDFLDLTVAQSASAFATVTTRTDIATKGIVAAAGLRYDATDRLHLGVSVFSPEVGDGTRRVFARVAAASPGVPAQIAVETDDELHASPTLPLRVQGGIAWTGTAWSVSADAIVLGPRSVHDDADRAADGLDRRIVRKTVVDGSLGAEYIVAQAVPIRAGVFTDRAASPDPVSHAAGTPDPNPANSDHVDRYGATLSLGYRTDHTETDLGAIVSYGAGHSDAPNLATGFTLEPTRETQRYAYVFVTSSYAF